MTSLLNRADVTQLYTQSDLALKAHEKHPRRENKEFSDQPELEHSCSMYAKNLGLHII